MKIAAGLILDGCLFNALPKISLREKIHSLQNPNYSDDHHT